MPWRLLMACHVLYAGDAPLNEASLLQLLSLPALAICFRLLDTDKHFVSLSRRILYEELPVYDDDKPAQDQPPRMTAFERYRTYSPTREELMENRRRQKIQEKRLARKAIVDALEAQRVMKEQRRLELLKSGELPDVYVEEEEEENADEYLPPPGLLIPGFYSPPNDVAKSNGLAILFPKVPLYYVTPEPEFLPPHVLVMLEISKRYKAVEAITPYKQARAGDYDDDDDDDGGGGDDDDDDGGGDEH
ncbi:Uncharacterized protein OBRU01_06849 [Operophtera brumata]|uniref:DUF4746 domain-containing protein n=1 Tax=Operophtera brumata TaxID=104452 RepID=A0A0L7LKB5_OPEBR|nr:Uncharacterized protein OBRU01_06849 [Operophtera brumata]